ncbi:hypothetical protein UPYG_G00301510 [Umbra pygmaea]|uniref:Uncharacterized protein n=1 Tax=Umbra pygmaea TaxID=75934 RepID=A0ABD0W7G2_UMBPY
MLFISMSPHLKAQSASPPTLPHTQVGLCSPWSSRPLSLLGSTSKTSTRCRHLEKKLTRNLLCTKGKSERLFLYFVPLISLFCFGVVQDSSQGRCPIVSAVDI